MATQKKTQTKSSTYTPSKRLMVDCPQCGKTAAKPISRVDAPHFRIIDYQCENCGKKFRIIS